MTSAFSVKWEKNETSPIPCYVGKASSGDTIVTEKMPHNKKYEVRLYGPHGQQYQEVEGFANLAKAKAFAEKEVRRFSK